MVSNVTEDCKSAPRRNAIAPVVIALGGNAILRLGQRGTACEQNDLAAFLLARQLCAQTLVLLTDVPAFSIGFGTPHQRALANMTNEEMEAFDAQGHFPAGGMGPKIQGALRFLHSGGELAVITSPENLVASLLGEAGTRTSASRQAGPVPHRPQRRK